ncbi:MAG: hypothetical protein LBU42_07520 [Prevotellaceae bacterium]|jgi:hypothetical protein|nr:hypothetical protein [Prevotellaceae bacterium]
MDYKFSLKGKNSPLSILRSPLMKWLRDDRKLLYLTAGLVVFGGIVRIVNHPLSVWLLNAAFIPYFIMRFIFYFKNRQRTWTAIERYRLSIFAVLFIIVVLNFFASYRIEFLLLILLMIDYLFVVNREV